MECSTRLKSETCFSSRLLQSVSFAQPINQYAGYHTAQSHRNHTEQDFRRGGFIIPGKRERSHQRIQFGYGSQVSHKDEDETVSSWPPKGRDKKTSGHRPGLCFILTIQFLCFYKRLALSFSRARAKIGQMQGPRIFHLSKYRPATFAASPGRLPAQPLNDPLP